jgi:hypothetical protein
MPVRKKPSGIAGGGKAGVILERFRLRRPRVTTSNTIKQEDEAMKKLMMGLAASIHVS